MNPVDDLYKKLCLAIFPNGPHPTHTLRFSDASSFDNKCTKCGRTDRFLVGWANLVLPCPEKPHEPVLIPRVFAIEQVKALCGGEFPLADGFAWDRVEYFLLEDGMLQPYAGEEILPGPGIVVTAKDEEAAYTHRL